jgi:hypothetical protein
MAWTTTTLLAQMRRIASLPSSTTADGYTSSDLLAHADTALQGDVLPLVTNARDEHGVHFEDVVVPSGQQYVRLPPRVLAGRLRDITRASPTTSPTSYLSVPRLEPEDVAAVGLQVPAGPDAVAVVIESGWLRVVPTPTSSVTLRISYIRTPSTLATVASCFHIQAVTPGANVVMTTFTGTPASARFDILLQSNGDSLGDRLFNFGGGAGACTFTASDFSPRFINTTAETGRYVVEGLWVCPAGTTCVIPLPNVVATLLAYRAAINFMHAIGDTEGVARAQDAADRMTAQVVPVINERIEGEPQVVRPRFGARGRSLWWGR